MEGTAKAAEVAGDWKKSNRFEIRGGRELCQSDECLDQVGCAQTTDRTGSPSKCRVSLYQFTGI
jgi:hypothetical protein